MVEKLLPQNMDAERSLLGCVLIDPEVMVEIHDIVRAEDFYRDAHKSIYAAMLTLYLKREPADLITLSEQLEQDGKLYDIGDVSYLVSLTNEVPTSLHAVHYARIVAQKALYRRLVHASGQIAAMAYDEHENAHQTAMQLLEQADRQGQASDFASFTDVLSGCMEKLDQMKATPGSIVGVPTGYNGLDRLTGGLQDSDLILLAARPGVGKTTLAQNIVYNATLKYDMRVAFFSLEMSREQLGYRFIAMDSRIDSQRLRTGLIDENRDEWDKISHSLGKLSEGKLWIDDTAGLDIDLMRSKARRLHAKEHIDLIVVDYLQQMHATVDGKRPHVREQEVSEIARKLKQVARDLNVPVLALAQLNRTAESHDVPQLSDLRESGQLEQEADIVTFIVRDDKAPGTLDIVIAKHRNGPLGSVRLGFDGKHTRFFNIDENGREIA